MKRRAIEIGVAAVVLSLGAHATGAAHGDRREDVPCGTDLPRMTAAQLPNCRKALCAPATPIQSKVCACLRSENTGDTVITVSDGESSSREIKTSVSPSGFDAESFRLISADFLGLRTDQLLIAVLNTQSNGMGVEYWSLWLVTRDLISHPLELNDFGVMSFLTASPSGKCEIFAANWRAGWEPKRGDGLYIVGLWREISPRGDISTDWNRPALYRRYLFDLERERNRAMSENDRRIVPWHTSPLARRVIGPYPVPGVIQ